MCGFYIKCKRYYYKKLKKLNEINFIIKNIFYFIRGIHLLLVVTLNSLKNLRVEHKISYWHEKFLRKITCGYHNKNILGKLLKTYSIYTIPNLLVHFKLTLPQMKKIKKEKEYTVCEVCSLL